MNTLSHTTKNNQEKTNKLNAKNRPFLKSRKNTFNKHQGREEVATNQPTTLVSASLDIDTAKIIQKVFSSRYLRVYTNQDIRGVELGGSLKNIIAIATGICDGLGFGDNTKAAIITRGIAEITRLGVKMGDLS